MPFWGWKAPVYLGGRENNTICLAPPMQHRHKGLTYSWDYQDQREGVTLSLGPSKKVGTQHSDGRGPSQLPSDTWYVLQEPRGRELWLPWSSAWLHSYSSVIHLSPCSSGPALRHVPCSFIWIWSCPLCLYSWTQLNASALQSVTPTAAALASSAVLYVTNVERPLPLFWSLFWSLSLDFLGIFENLVPLTLHSHLYPANIEKGVFSMWYWD